ncbi:serine/threonine-protein phosphatase, partial [Micrococcus endophyticus]
MEPSAETPAAASRPKAAGATHVGAVRELNEDAWT